MTWRGANRHQTGLAGRRTGAAGGTVGRELLLVGWRQSLSMMRHRRGPPLARRSGLPPFEGLRFFYV